MCFSVNWCDLKLSDSRDSREMKPISTLYESLWCLDKLRSFIQYGRLYMSRILAMLSSIAISEHPFQSSGAVEPNISLHIITDSAMQKYSWKQQEWQSHMNSIMTLQGPSSANCLCNKLLNWSMALVQCPSTYLRRVFSGNFLRKIHNARIHGLPILWKIINWVLWWIQVKELFDGLDMSVFQRIFGYPIIGVDAERLQQELRVKQPYCSMPCSYSWTERIKSSTSLNPGTRTKSMSLKLFLVIELSDCTNLSLNKEPTW